MSTLSERIRWVMQNFHLTQTELAEIAGVKQPSVANWLNGKTKSLMSGPALSICRKLPVLQDWLVNGVGEPMPKGSSVTVCFPEEEQTAPAGFVFVKAYRVECAAGHEFFNYELDDQVEGKSYRESWIQKHHYNPEKLKIFKVHGDSMSPFLWDGDSITVDTAQTDILSDKVYAFCYAGSYRVKRLRKKMNGDVQVISDNPSWDVEVIPSEDTEQLHIIGRVVDRSGTGGL